MAKISRTKAAELILGSKGKFFTVIVSTKSNPSRTMNCQLRLKGSKVPDVTKLGMVRVWEPKTKAFKTVNLQNLKSLSITGQTYSV